MNLKQKKQSVIFMKKLLVAIVMCVVMSFALVCAHEDNTDAVSGYAIEFNGEITGSSSIVQNNSHYVPMRMICEKMGAAVFFRSRDNKILVLSRNGDVIFHTVGDNVITINEKQTEFKNASFTRNYVTYIPMDMVMSVFYPDDVSTDNEKLSIQKQFSDNYYNRIIEGLLAVSKDGNFYPERFQSYINYQANMPTLSARDVVFRVNLGLDKPFYENIKTIEYPHELLVLVNKYNKLPSGFMQYNLVNMDKQYVAKDGKQYLLLDTVYNEYVRMSNAAKSAGLSMWVVSAYRTEDYQRNLYNDRVRTSGIAYADNYSARPGHSEHQTGMAVDLGCAGGTFEYSPEFKWMQNHAHEYGFILRYPKGKEWITGYSYEPWHYRYVGAQVAGIIHREGITYEEYCAKYMSVNEYK